MTRLFFACALSAALPLLMAAQAVAASDPDYVTMGGGSFDFDRASEKRTGVDYRAEYQWGVSLLPAIDSEWRASEAYVTLHPTIGFEATSTASYYGSGGLNLDVPFLRHGIFTWGESVGYFAQRQRERAIGSVIEFRSQVELGWRFDNNVRLTGYLSHISNEGIGRINPGAETLGGYVHIPIDWTGGQ